MVAPSQRTGLPDERFAPLVGDECFEIDNGSREPQPPPNPTELPTAARSLLAALARVALPKQACGEWEPTEFQDTHPERE